MTEQEWVECEDPEVMERFVRARSSKRKARLYYCACCRHIWELMTDERSRNGVLIAEAFADGNVSADELAIAHQHADEAAGIHTYDVFNMASLTTEQEVSLNGYVALTAHNHANGHLYSYCDLLLCIFGPLPFRLVTLDPAWLTPTVQQLAAVIYEERQFGKMPLLGDALEEAGCDNADVLQHCRSGGEHVRGCWVVDRVLGKE